MAIANTKDTTACHLYALRTNFTISHMPILNSLGKLISIIKTIVHLVNKEMKLWHVL